MPQFPNRDLNLNHVRHNCSSIRTNNIVLKKNTNMSSLSNNTKGKSGTHISNVDSGNGDGNNIAISSDFSFHKGNIDSRNSMVSSNKNRGISPLQFNVFS